MGSFTLPKLATRVLAYPDGTGKRRVPKLTWGDEGGRRPRPDRGCPRGGEPGGGGGPGIAGRPISHVRGAVRLRPFLRLRAGPGDRGHRRDRPDPTDRLR